jgi:hypothetical protein
LTARFRVEGRAIEQETPVVPELSMSAHTSAKFEEKRVAMIEALGRESS